MHAITLLIISVGLAGCASSLSAIPSINPKPCAAEKPVIDIVHTAGHFVISDSDMGKITGYIAALESGCVAPE